MSAEATRRRFVLVYRNAIPGAMGDITGNQGTTFAVQSLWSNDSAGGVGYCAGAGIDLPDPLG